MKVLVTGSICITGKCEGNVVCHSTKKDGFDVIIEGNIKIEGDLKLNDDTEIHSAGEFCTYE